MFEQSLFEVSPSTIELGNLPFDLYSPHENGMLETIAYRGSAITERIKARLEQRKRRYYVHEDDLDMYTEYAYGRLERIINNERVETPEKSKVLYLVGKRALKKLLENPMSGEAVKDASIIVEHYVDSILTSQEAVSNLLAISSMDAYTFSHSINVSTFNLLLGRKLFGNNRQKLWEIGMAGMLHDIGKTMVDQAVLFKPGRLDPMEMEIVKKHAEHSYSIIKKHGFKKEIQLAGRNHHERFEGGGYPDKIKGYDIHHYARITTVSDVYDAITSSRVYKPGENHVDALRKMAESYGHFDLDIFNQLLELVLRNRKLVIKFQRQHMADAIRTGRLLPGKGARIRHQFRK